VELPPLELGKQAKLQCELSVLKTDYLWLPDFSTPGKSDCWKLAHSSCWLHVDDAIFSGPPPWFFVSVADKGLSGGVSGLESTDAGGSESVDSKGDAMASLFDAACDDEREAEEPGSGPGRAEAQ
jgi:hypothetical protein